MSSFIISHFSYCPLNWMFSSKLSAKNKDAVHKRFLQIILNDYESPWSLLFEEAHKATFHQWCIILLRSKFITTWMDIWLTKSLKLSNLSDIKASFIEIRTWYYFILCKQNLVTIAYSNTGRIFFSFFQTSSWKYEDCPYRSCKIFIQNVRYIWLGPISISIDWSI